MNSDLPHRRFRYIEVLSSEGERASRKRFFEVTDGWLELANELRPGSPAALVEGDDVARLPDGSVFLEVSFKTEHPVVEAALPQWATGAGRRWAKLNGQDIVTSDGLRIPVEEIEFEASAEAAGLDPDLLPISRSAT